MHNNSAHRLSRKHTPSACEAETDHHTQADALQGLEQEATQERRLMVALTDRPTTTHDAHIQHTYSRRLVWLCCLEGDGPRIEFFDRPTVEGRGRLYLACINKSNPADAY